MTPTSSMPETLTTMINRLTDARDEMVFIQRNHRTMTDLGDDCEEVVSVSAHLLTPDGTEHYGFPDDNGRHVVRRLASIVTFSDVNNVVVATVHLSPRMSSHLQPALRQPPREAAVEFRSYFHEEWQTLWSMTCRIIHTASRDLKNQHAFYPTKGPQ